MQFACDTEILSSSSRTQFTTSARAKQARTFHKLLYIYATLQHKADANLKSNHSLNRSVRICDFIRKCRHLTVFDNQTPLTLCFNFLLNLNVLSRRTSRRLPFERSNHWHAPTLNDGNGPGNHKCVNPWERALVQIVETRERMHVLGELLVYLV